MKLVELSVHAGADVFARDRKVRMVNDGLSNDDCVRVFLRQCASRVLIPSGAFL